MNKKYILGLDGGATKSHIAIFDDSGNGKCIAASAYGSLNHENMAGSYDELEEHLKILLSRTLGEAGIKASDVAFSVFGMAGIDTKAQSVIVADMITGIGFDKNNIFVCNDAILGVPAGCPGGVGICAINGTGFKLAAIDRYGMIQDTCGLGAITDDKGGGTWYAERACGEVYNALYRLGRPTKMREMVFEHLGITDKYEYIDAMIKRFFDNTDSLSSVSFSKIVFDAAQLGDEAALEILEESARQYGGAIARLGMDMYFPCDEVLHVTLAGSVFVKQESRILHDKIAHHVKQILGKREVSYTTLDTHPVSGAIVLAAQKAGLDITTDTVKTEISTITL